jgi:glycosyltransferase involved in cell wall biosynthesis
MLSISVIICAYNPNVGIFKRCLEAIIFASLHKAPAEILIIDNNSSVPLDEEPFLIEFLQQTGNAKVIRETNPGLTNARIRGIKESKGQLLVFVDDDNIIAANFFSKAVEIASRYPFIGAFSGQVFLEFEKEPEVWTKPYWGLLVSRKFTGNHWSNLIFNNDTMPCGAGLCITKDVGIYYVQLHESGKRGFNLDRSKGSLLSGGDNDLAMCACDIDRGMGLFEDLQLRHYIPETRVSLNYLSRLAYGIYFSSVVLKYLRTGKIDEETMTGKIKHLIRKSLSPRHDRVIQNACRKGLDDARKMLQSKSF